MTIQYVPSVLAQTIEEQCVNVFAGSGRRCDYRVSPTSLPCPNCGGRICADCERVGDRHDSIACKVKTDGKPFVGCPASFSYATDRYPATVIEVSKSGHRIVIQRDRDEVVAGSAHDGSAVYVCTPNPEGPTDVATRRKDGQYRIQGCQGYGRVWFGRSSRRAYRDPSF